MPGRKSLILRARGLARRYFLRRDKESPAIHSLKRIYERIGEYQGEQPNARRMKSRMGPRAERHTSRSPESAAEAASLFKVYADPTRLRILHLLYHAGELCVGDIVTVLGLPQPTISRHLRQLRKGGLVSVRQLGLWVYYRVAAADTCLGAVLVDGLGRCLRDAPEMRADHARLEEVRAAGGCCAPTPDAEVIPVAALVPRRRHESG
jgi:ArsR family transcriptional regulator